MPDDTDTPQDMTGPTGGSDALRDDFDELNTIAGLKKGDLIIGRFKLQRCLGRGGMGEVWLAHDETLDERLALKLLPRLIHFDERAVEDLKNETRRGRQLSHPNIVRVFDFYKDAQNVCIAMEFVDGENLAVLHAREPNGAFTVERITPWVRQLLNALHYAHRTTNVVVHRDLKPANLLIESANQALKVVDFGIARCVADSMMKVTVSAQPRGTLCYMSPEQAMGRGANPLDDVYAVGVTLYELLAGRPPFYSGDITTQILKVPPPPIAERQKEQGFLNPPPANWEEVIMRCLAKERAQRPQSIGEVMEQLGLGGGLESVPYSVTTADGHRPTGTQQPWTGPHTGAATAATAPGNTGGISVSTSAPVVTVATHTQRSFGGLTQRSGGGTATVPAPITVTQAPSDRKRVPWLSIAAGALLVCALAGAAVWWKKPKPGVQRPISPVAVIPKPAEPTATPVPVAKPLGAPVVDSTKPVAGVDWRVPEDFPTVQDALNAVTQPGQKIIVGAKTFAQRIQIKTAVHLVGAGAQQTIVSVDGQGGAALEVLDTAKDVTIEAMTFRHSGEQELGSAQPVARLRGGKVRIQNCTFSQAMDAGLVAAGETTLTLLNCKFLENQGPGLKLTEGAKASIEGCDFQRNDRGAALELAGTSATFTRCQFDSNAFHGIEASDQAAFAARNCKIAGSGQSGVFVVDAGTSGNVEDCDVTGGQQGLQAERGASLTIRKCRIKGSILGIATQNAGDVTLADSQISGNQSHGVVLTAPEGRSGTIQLINNKILENAGVGLIVEGGSLMPDVQSNQIGPNGHIDVLVRGKAGGSYRANTLLSKLADDGHNYYIEPESPAEWSADNKEQPPAK